MKKAALSTLCLILILTVQGFAQGQLRATVDETGRKPRSFSAEWRLRLSGADYSDEQSQSKIVDLRTEIKAHYLLHSSLYLDLQPALRLQSGTTQFVDGADQVENKISLNHAALVYRPVGFIRASAGTLNQRDMHTSIFVDSIAFPAARLETQTRLGSLLTGLAVETAMPTSTSLSTNTKELEATPSLNTAALRTRWQPTRNTSVRAAVGYFLYNNLPSAVAQKSGLLGNEVLKISDAQYAFVNTFEGWESSVEARLPLTSRISAVFGGEYLMNQKAPSDVNSGYRYYLAGEFHLNAQMALVAEGSYFAIAPEAAVSYFNASGFETNRVGYGAEAYLSFKKLGFNVGAKYTDAEVMFTNAIQSREKTIMLKLETFYADI